jgi:outer membrane protein TolC
LTCGVADFLTVLDAEPRMLQAQDQLAQSETVTATAFVAVYKTLGGAGSDKTSLFSIKEVFRCNTLGSAIAV